MYQSSNMYFLPSTVLSYFQGMLIIIYVHCVILKSDGNLQGRSEVIMIGKGSMIFPTRNENLQKYHKISKLFFKFFIDEQVKGAPIFNY